MRTIHGRTVLDCFQTVMIEESPEHALFTPYRMFSSTSVHVDSTTPHGPGVDIVDRDTRERFLMCIECAESQALFGCIVTDRLLIFSSWYRGRRNLRRRTPLAGGRTMGL